MAFISFKSSFAQIQLEVEGQLRLGVADTVTFFDQVLVRKSDGIIAVSSISQNDPVEVPKPIPYTDTWKDYNVGYQRGYYYKQDERVYLDGTIRKSGYPDTIWSDSDTLCVLPVDYRPRKRMIVFAKHNLGNVRLNIEPRGTVWFVDGHSGIDWINLDGLSFYRNETPTVADLAIGTSHGGGIIFYRSDPPRDLNGDGQLNYGLVAAPYDLPITTWGCEGTEIEGDQQSGIGDGSQNTKDILANACHMNDGIVSAAEACDNLSIDEFDDWFLPSTLELGEMNKKIGPYNNGDNLGNFTIQGQYWSSDEEDASTARGIVFVINPSIIYFTGPKGFNEQAVVRAIRAY